jgi:glycosyltransferase involved in cell wall biosynthesis
MDILYICGMIDRKLESKLSPLQANRSIKRIFLIRKKIFIGKKIHQFTIPNIFISNYVISEFYRIFLIVYTIIKYKPKYIIGAGLIPHGIYSNILGTLFFRKKILLLMGELELPLTYPIISLKQKFLMKIAFMANMIGVRGNNSKEKLVSHMYHPNKIFIADNTFSVDDFYKIADVKKYFDLIYVGNISKEKRIDILVDIIKNIENTSNISLKVLIIGTGPQKNHILDYIEQKELKSKSEIKFVGFCDKKEINQFLNESRILVLTSEVEGLPMVLIESISSGTPVISHDIANISEIVSDNENGYLINFQDVPSFANKILHLLNNKLEYKRIVNNCINDRIIFKAKYSVKSISSTWRKILI